MVEQLENLWNLLLDITSVFVIPNWNDPIGWLPLLLLVGVVGPLLSLVVLFWLRYVLLRPRVSVTYEDERRLAPIGADGEPVYPTGEAYCARDRLIHAPGDTRCSVCGDDLLVACPKCELVRSAAIPTCGNCGLTFTLKPRGRELRPAGPPPGGAAVA